MTNPINISFTESDLDSIAEIEGKEVNVMLSRATGLEIDWLREMFPEDFDDGEGCRFDATARQCQGVQRRADAGE